MDIGNPLKSVNFVVLAGLSSPGRCTIVGAGSPRDWDVRKGYGFQGAVTVYTGENLKPFDLIIDLWDFPKHWIEWQAFAVILKKPLPGIRPVALGIYHPILSAPPIEITEVVVTNVTAFEQGEEDASGMFTTRITLLPYKKPKPVLGKPIAAIPAVPKPQPVAADAREVEIQRLLGEQKALGGAL